MNLRRFGALIWKVHKLMLSLSKLQEPDSLVCSGSFASLWWYKAAANPLVLPSAARFVVPHIARAHQWALPSELPVYMELGWISPEKRGPVWDYQHSLLPCITLAPGSASRKTLCKSEQKENIMWEEIARLLFKCQRDSDLFWVLEEMWERDICQILGLPIWLLWTTFLFLLSP